MLLRALAPAVALWVAISAFGRLLTGPMVGWNHSEIALNRSLQDIPVLVAYARLYRGMHHLSDVVVGAINGLVCAALAAHCLLHRRRLPASDS